MAASPDRGGVHHHHRHPATLQVFKWNSEEVFGIARDVAVPFSPVIGANNEELLSGLPELAPQAPQERKKNSDAPHDASPPPRPDDRGPG